MTGCAYGYLGDPDRTSGWFSTTGHFVHTDNIGMITTNIDQTGNRPIWVFELGADYISGPGTAQINYQGVVTGGNYLFGSSGGVFRSQIYNNGGTVYFGRNTGNGYNTYENGSFGWTGGICGWYNWGGPPGAATMVEATPEPGGVILVRFAGSGDTGCLNITGWTLAWRQQGGPWNYMASSGTTYFQGTPGVTYDFCAAGRNQVTDALGRYGAFGNIYSATARAGGSIYDAGAWQPATPYIYDSGAWVNANGTIYDNGAWAPVS